MKEFFEGLIGTLVSFARLCAAVLVIMCHSTVWSTMWNGALAFVQRKTIIPAIFLILTPFVPLWATRAWGVEGAVATTWIMLFAVSFLMALFISWHRSPYLGSRPRFAAFGFGCALGFISSGLALLVMYGVLQPSSYSALLELPVPMFQAIIVVAMLADLASIWFHDKGNAD